MTGLDRWVLAEFAQLEKNVAEAYDQYEFHAVYQRITQFVTVELSAIYHDAVKDRLYTDPANSSRRRSTQTALHRMVTGLCKMLSPILAFTADEAWEFVPGKQADSVHELTWQPVEFAQSEPERQAWKALFHLRDFALPVLEKARQAKQIGKALEAKLIFTGDDPTLTHAESEKEALRELLNVSQLEVRHEMGKTLEVHVPKADGQKCERCWHWETDVGSNPEHPTICARCVRAVEVAVAVK